MERMKMLADVVGMGVSVKQGRIQSGTCTVRLSVCARFVDHALVADRPLQLVVNHEA